MCTSEIVDKLSAVQKNAVSGRIRHVCVLFIDLNTDGCCKSHVTLVSTQSLDVRSKRVGAVWEGGVCGGSQI